MGVKVFYDSLKKGGTEPLFFYVSSSEWNLYDFLESFVADKQNNCQPECFYFRISRVVFWIFFAVVVVLILIRNQK